MKYVGFALLCIVTLLFTPNRIGSPMMFVFLPLLAWTLWTAYRIWVKPSKPSDSAEY